MEVLTLTVVCHERRPPADDIFLHPGRGDREDPGGAGRDPGRAGQPVLDSLTRGPCQVPAADARDGRRGNQAWSVITMPVSA
jgi:hypothetical protein